MPVVLLRQDALSGEFELMERYEPNINVTTIQHDDNITGPMTRMLWSIRDGEFEVRGLIRSDNSSSVQQENDLLEFNTSQDSSTYFYARECSCFNNSDLQLSFCPMTIDVCLWNETSLTPICRKVPRDNNSFVNTMYYYLPVWFLILVFLCFLRKGVGANTRDCMLSLCIPNYREWLAGRILRNNPERARELYRSYYIHREAEIDRRNQQLASVINNPEVLQQYDEMQREQLETVRPWLSGIDIQGPLRASTPSLLLRTLIYRKIGIGEEDTEEESCAICVTGFADGDRIGNLEVCDHKFHVNCLKQWLRRKNTCPLCQKEGIAKLL
jgi:hypothetical protein